MSTPDLDRLRARLVVIAADATNHPLTFGHMIMRAMNEVVEPLAAENAALREQVQRVLEAAQRAVSETCEDHGDCRNLWREHDWCPACRVLAAFDQPTGDREQVQREGERTPMGGKGCICDLPNGLANHRDGCPRWVAIL